MNKFSLIAWPLIGCGKKEVAEDKLVRSVRAIKIGDAGIEKLLLLLMIFPRPFVISI